MTKEITFIKRVAKSGRGYLIWIPKDVVDFIPIEKNDFVEIKIKKLGRKK